jgi:hypothetical protein
MSAFTRARVAAARRHASLWRLRIFVSLLPLALAGCSAAPAAFDRQPDPSHAQAAAPAVTYRPVLDGYRSRRPVTPADWRGVNDGVAPKTEAR